MNTLIIYDSTGYIITTASGSIREPIGIPFIWVEIPEKKRIVSVDVSVTPNVAILVDMPLTETELLQQQVNDLNLAMASIMGV